MALRFQFECCCYFLLSIFFILLLLFALACESNYVVAIFYILYVRRWWMVNYIQRVIASNTCDSLSGFCFIYLIFYFQTVDLQWTMSDERWTERTHKQTCTFQFQFRSIDKNSDSFYCLFYSLISDCSILEMLTRWALWWAFIEIIPKIHGIMWFLSLIRRHKICYNNVKSWNCWMLNVNSSKLIKSIFF